MSLQAFAGVVDLGTGSQFAFMFSLPSTEAWPAGSPMSGSIRVEATDLLDSGDAMASVLNVAPTSVYIAKINGVVQQELLMDPFSFTVNDAGGSDSFTASFSGVTTAALGIGDSVSMEVGFTTLGGGDSAGFDAEFFVGIPEPGVSWLSGLACISAFLRRRRGWI